MGAYGLGLPPPLLHEPVGRADQRPGARDVLVEVDPGDQFATAAHASLFEHGLEVVLHRVGRQEQPGGDVLGVQSLQDGLVSSQLAGTYTTTTSYHPDGSVKTVQLPAMGGLAAETLSYGYTARGDAKTLTGNISGVTSTYVSSTRYRDLGGVSMMTLGSVTGKNTYLNYVRDATTDRLTTIRVDRQGVSGAADIASYSYDNAGNITRIASDLPGGSDDIQCFSYDYQRQLTQAWTPAGGDCAATRSQAALGGPAPYWTSWTHDTIGRTTQRVSRTATSQATATFAYPANGQPKPHFVTGATLDTGGATTSASYAFDEAGNTTSRPGAGGTQQLGWNSEGRLAQVSVNGTTTAQMVYDAGGSRILRKQNATTTLTLGDTELEQSGTGWAGERAFVGGTKDATGLIHVGAREYDPDLNRFVSVDPVQNFDDPLSWNAYIYSNNSPVTFSDPTGEMMTMMIADWGGRTTSVRNLKSTAKSYRAPTTPTSYSYHRPTPQHQSPSPAPTGTAQSGPTNNPIANFLGGAVNGFVDSFADNVFMVGRGVGLLARVTPWGDQVNNFVDDAENQYHQTTRNIALSMGLDPDSAAYGAGKITDELASMAIPAGGAMKAASKLSKLGKLGKLEDVGDMANAVCRVNSFDEDTPVLMADGTLKPIVDVDYGDLVWAADPETGEAGPREVLDVTGQPIRIAQVHISQRNLTAYNLTVDQLHTYYVGTTPTLVHNCRVGRSGANPRSAD